MALEIKKPGSTDASAEESGAEKLLSAESRMERVARLAPAQGNVAASNVPGVRAEPNYDPFHLTGLVADRNLYLDKDETTVLESLNGSGTLLAPKGANIPPEVVARYGLELKGDKVEQGKNAEGKPNVAAPGRINEGQIDDGRPLVKAPTTGILRPEPAPEHPMTKIEEEIKGTNPEPGSKEAEAAAKAKEPKPAAKTMRLSKSAAKAARKGKGR